MSTSFTHTAPITLYHLAEGRDAFYLPTPDAYAGAVFLTALHDYDDFLMSHQLLDSNLTAGGLMVKDGDDDVEWTHDGLSTGQTIHVHHLDNLHVQQDELRNDAARGEILDGTFRVTITPKEDRSFTFYVISSSPRSSEVDAIGTLITLVNYADHLQRIHDPHAKTNPLVSIGLHRYNGGEWTFVPY